MSSILGCYLPERLRRWFIYLPIDLLLVLLLAGGGVLIYAATISSAPFYDDAQVADDIDAQLRHLEGVLQRPSAGAWPDIYLGYSPLCGRHVEWPPIFYTFYGMALSELLQAAPSRRDDILAHLDLCARGITHVPDEVNDADVPAYLEAHPPVSSTLMNGYVGVVLGLREAAAGDGLYADALTLVAESLADTIGDNCDHAGAVWTSDQATQLYAIWLHDQVNGTDHGTLFSRWRDLIDDRFLEERTGLLVSYISVSPDAYLSEPRGTSLNWTVIFLADVMPEFAREQYEKMRRHREQRIFSMAAVAEYRKGALLSFGDLDSGPLVFGISPAATGFALGAHKLFGDEQRFARGYRVFELFGRPRREGETSSYYLANAMGDAILLYAKVARPRVPPPNHPDQAPSAPPIANQLTINQ